MGPKLGILHNQTGQALQIRPADGSRPFVQGSFNIFSARLRAHNLLLLTIRFGRQ